MRGRILVAAAAALTIVGCSGDDTALDETAMGADTFGVDMPATTTPTTSATTQNQGTATLINAQGDTVGEATLRSAGNGVTMTVMVEGLEPGEKGIHFHQVGQCDPPTFQTAGAHFAPENRQHGFENPQGPHAGDLRNLVVGSDGSAQQEFTNEMVTLGDGPNSLFDNDGTALMIHAGPDDYTTDPSGESGDRIACGVITRG